MRRLMPIAASVAVLAAGCAAAPQVSELDSTRLAVMRPSPVLDCPRHTGTRIKRDDGSCASVSGRAFTIHDKPDAFRHGRENLCPPDVNPETVGERRHTPTVLTMGGSHLNDFCC